MDVLKEIKEAEKQAEAIEREYRAKAAALLQALPIELQKEKERREAKLAEEITGFRAGNQKDKEKARETVAAQSASEFSTLEAQARANMPKALDILMKALDL
jgi:hypothetical protein